MTSRSRDSEVNGPGIRPDHPAVDRPESGVRWFDGPPTETLGSTRAEPSDGGTDSQGTAGYSDREYQAWRDDRRWRASESYRIIKPLATGGLGNVFVGCDEVLDRLVAIKKIRPELAEFSAARSRFLVEARVTGRLEHPGVVPIYALGTDERGQPYYAMRLIEGQTLGQAIRQFHDAARSRGQGPSYRSLEFRELLSRYLTVCDVVAYAHDRRVLHRDLKPANVMLGPFGETMVVDWGVAKVLSTADPAGPAGTQAQQQSAAAVDPTTAAEPGAGDDATEAIPVEAPASRWGGTSSEQHQTQPGSRVGTKRYMSPEQELGLTQKLGPACDLYSLGATLYELLTGKPPLADIQDRGELTRRTVTGEIPAPRALQPAVPILLEAICRKAMALQPEQRYATATALADDLRRWLADEPIAGVHEPLRQRLSRWERRHRSLIRIAVVALMLTATTAIAAALLVWRASRNEHVALRNEIVQRQSAQDAQRKAQDAQRSAQVQNCTLLLQRGLELAERSEDGKALLWLTRALESLPGECSDSDRCAPLERAIRTALNLIRARITAPIAVLSHDGQPILHLAFQPESQVLATGDASGRVRLWQTANGQPLQVQAPGEASGTWTHPGAITALRYASRAPALLIGTESGQLLVRDPRSGSPLGPPIQCPQAVTTAVIRGDGGQVAAGARDGTVGCWNAATGEPVVPLHRHAARIVTVAYSADQRRLLSADEAGTIRVIDLETGQTVGPAIEHPGAILGAALRPDGAAVLSYGFDGKARLWELTGHDQTRRDQPSQTLNHRGPIAHAEFSTDGVSLLTTGHTTLTRVWEAATGEEQVSRLGSVEHRTFILRAHFDAEGQTVVTASLDRSVRLWDAEGQNPISNPLPHTDQLEEAILAPDGRTLAGLTQTQTGTVRLWRLGGDAGLGVVASPRGPTAVLSLACLPDGHQYLTAEGRAGVQLRDAATHLPLVPPWQPADDPWRAFYEVRTLSLSRDGRRVIAGGLASPPTTARHGPQPAGLAQVCDLVTGQPVGPALFRDQEVKAVALSPDGQVAATGSLDHRVRLSWVATGEALTPDLVHPDDVLSLVFSADGQTLITGCRDGQVRAWDLRTRSVRWAQQAHDDGVRVLALHPDGLRLASGSLDGTIQLREVATGSVSGPMLPHERRVTGLAFSPDGTRLASVGDGRLLRIWDVRSGLRLGPGLRHRNAIWCVAFTTDGQAVLTGSEDRIVRRWLMPRQAQDPVPFLKQQAKVLAAMELNDDSSFHTFTDAEWQQERQALEAATRARASTPDPTRLQAHADPTSVSRMLPRPERAR